MRYKLMNILEQVDNVTFYDPTSIDWNSFPFATGFYKHIVSKQEIIKPYLIPYAYYGDVEYEDIILLLNQIEFVWDMVAGTEIRVPKKEELDSFILTNRK